MTPYSDKEKCTGCGACAEACFNNSIRMESDDDGFLYPIVIAETCINCGRCTKVCDMSRVSSLKREKRAFLAFSRNEELRQASSSGGVFSELANYYIENGGVVYGGAFDYGYSGVSHIRCDTPLDLHKIQGSKYIQSKMSGVFMNVRRDLEQGREVLFSGTPCQINGIKAFLDKEYSNFLCISVICHGVPSPKVWEEYLHSIEMTIGKVLYVDFRDKRRKGWLNYHITMKGLKRDYSVVADEDYYMNGFIENLFLRPSCYACDGIIKTENADIILGDYWGCEKQFMDLDHFMGCSAVIVNTPRGQRAIDSLNSKLTLKDSSVYNIKKENPSYDCRAVENIYRRAFFNSLNNKDEDIQSLLRRYVLKRHTNEFKERQRVIVELFKNSRAFERAGGLKEYIYNNNVCLYAYTDITKELINALSKCGGKKTVYVSDRDIEKLKNSGFKRILSKDEMKRKYTSRLIRKVIICSLYYLNDIFDEMVAEGFDKSDLISVESVVWDCIGA